MPAPSRRRVAVVGGGIAGLACAYYLRGVADVHLFERAPRLGGHVHAARVPWAGGEVDVETGFLAFHRSRYPRLAALLDAFGVETAPSGVGLAIWDQPEGLLYRHQDWFGMFGDRLPPALRGELTSLLTLIFRHEKRPEAHPYPNVRLDAFLAGRGCDPALARHVIVPSIAALWGFQPAEIMAMSARTVLASLARFMGASHDEPFERIAPSTRGWIDRLAAGTGATIAVNARVDRVDAGRVILGGEVLAFDHVVVATHADTALALLAAPTPAQAQVLGAIPYRRTMSLLHDDVGVLPPDPAAWDDYTYVLRQEAGGEVASTTWHMGRLQGQPGNLLVTVGPPDLLHRGWLRPERVLFSASYTHPAMTPEAVEAREGLPRLNAGGPVWFCGSYFGETGSNECAIEAAWQVAEGIRG